ncbi:hypothetical protein Avbf_11120, partial [Armadillidium vulgare]
MKGHMLAVKIHQVLNIEYPKNEEMFGHSFKEESTTSLLSGTGFKSQFYLFLSNCYILNLSLTVKCIISALI